MNWEKVILKDISNNIQYGYTASASEEPIGPKFLRITDIVPDTIDWNSVPYCVIDDKQIGKYKLNRGDIVIARTGNTTGYAKLIRTDIDSVFASYLIRVQIDEELADAGYIGRLVESEAYKRFVNSVKGGAAQGNANAQLLTSFELLLPPLHTQQKISTILSAYDELIENNLKRIKLLEEAAQLLYRQWFVNFKFPGHEKTKFINGIPEGWANILLSDVAEINARYIIDKKTFTTINYIDISSVTTGIIHNKTVYELSEAPGRARRMVKDGDIIWSNVRPNRRSYCLFLDPLENDIVSTGFTVLSAVRVPFTFLYQAVTTDEFVGYLVNNAMGAAYPAVKGSDFEKAEILIPTDDILEEFHVIAEPMHRKIHSLLKINNKLKEARDILLPRLMDGSIEV